jgi:hypothetical protein
METITKLEEAIGLQKYSPSTKYSLRPGLYVENGKVMHGGKEYSSIGANFFSAFYNAFITPSSKEYNEVFDLMNSYGIEYCRLNFGLFWPINYKKWDENKQLYYQTMDEVVKSAEQHKIGLICSMFWNTQGVSDFYDEPANAWGDKNSKTRQYMADYIQLVVSRYKESPSIWGWEFSNEFNLVLDLPNAADLRNGTIHPGLGTRLKRDKNDDLTTDIATPLLKDFAVLVRKYDPYNRIITSGNGEPRPTQYNQRVNNIWKTDTQSEMAQTIDWHDPAPMDCVSIHTYDLLERFLEDNSYTNILKVFKDESLKQGKALFIGEFHWAEPNYEQIVDAIVLNKIPLSAVWSLGEVEYSLATKPERQKQVLTYIKNANQKLK